MDVCFNKDYDFWRVFLESKVTKSISFHQRKSIYRTFQSEDKDEKAMRQIAY